MATDGTSTAYSSAAAEVYDEERFTSASGKRLHKAEIDLVFWMLRRIPKGGKVLEVGCGTGRIVVELLKAGYGVHGVDASSDMLERLRSKIDSAGDPGWKENLELTVCGAADLPIADNTYDAVYSVRLLNQTESPEYALRVVDEMVRVTKDDGYILVEFVNAYRPRWGAARRQSTRLRPAEVIARGRDAGAEVAGVRGAFFLSMQAYAHCPESLLGALDSLDRLLSRSMPRLCARTYVLLRKSTRD